VKIFTQKEKSTLKICLFNRTCGRLKVLLYVLVEHYCCLYLCIECQPSFPLMQCTKFVEE